MHTLFCFEDSDSVELCLDVMYHHFSFSCRLNGCFLPFKMPFAAGHQCSLYITLLFSHKRLVLKVCIWVSKLIIPQLLGHSRSSTWTTHCSYLSHLYKLCNRFISFRSFPPTVSSSYFIFKWRLLSQDARFLSIVQSVWRSERTMSL